eukprot:6204990-Pleurochrysis_carterae.AAC.1
MRLKVLRQCVGRGKPYSNPTIRLPLSTAEPCHKMQLAVATTYVVNASYFRSTRLHREGTEAKSPLDHGAAMVALRGISSRT